MPSRRFIQNALVINTEARVCSMPNSGAHLLLIARWGFSAAFPSLAHEWLFRILLMMKFPEGLLNFIAGVYFCSGASATILGVERTLFTATSGVLQGCPLSGMLFAMCLAPFSAGDGRVGGQLG